MRIARGCPHCTTNRIGQLNVGEAFARSLGVCRTPQGMTLGDMSVSILSVGAEVFQFIQGIESRYRIGGNGSMSPVFAAAFWRIIHSPQAASDGSVRADAKKAVSRLRTIGSRRDFC